MGARKSNRKLHETREFINGEDFLMAWSLTDKFDINPDEYKREIERDSDDDDLQIFSSRTFTFFN